MTAVACLKAVSGSPTDVEWSRPRLVAIAVLTKGASEAAAASTDAMAGSSAQTTSTISTASSASALVAATTA
ncbi:MAG TPA: hypothetical protein VGG11_00040, partial [Xanthobacteraceae bacterium]